MRDLAHVAGIDRAGQLLRRLSQREQLLVQVGFGGGLGGQPAPQNIRIALASADQSRTQVASLVGSATQTDPLLGAATYFYRTEPGDLRTGSKLVVLFEAKSAGVLVPFNSVVWHAGKPWAYVIEGEDKRGVKFERRAVDIRDEAAQGWVNPSTFKAGEQIVTGGAQMLLSEELRKGAVDDD